jgi:hypothetical protein
MEERIGLQLQGRELQWQRRQRINKDQDILPNPLNQFCGLSEVITPVKVRPNHEEMLLSDHIPETVFSSQITMDNENQVILEECNLLNVEVWNEKERDEQLCEENNLDNEEALDSSEDSFDREKWHRSVLKACTQHASQLNLSFYEPISFGFDDRIISKLRVELDAEIPIPTQFRTLWYQLHHDIRKFYNVGLLYPITNDVLTLTDHWRNNNILGYRYLPRSIYMKVLSIPVSTFKTLFPSDYRGRVTLVMETPNQIPSQTTTEIFSKYDLWYWKAMRTARRMDMDPSSPRRAYNKLRGHSRKEAYEMTASEWRAHHFHMLEAIERNKLLREPPQMITKEFSRC